MATATRTPIIARTMSSSNNVKPALWGLWVYMVLWVLFVVVMVVGVVLFSVIAGITSFPFHTVGGLLLTLQSLG